MKHGLIKQPKAEYEQKQLIKQIEGIGGTGEIVEWIDDWMVNERIRNKYDEEGCSYKTIYQKFSHDNLLLIESGTWSESKFLDALWDYVKSKNYLEWNPHKANKGNTRTQRRWRVGKAGSQEDWVKIVDTREKVMVKLKNKGVVLDNPITPIDGLE